LFAIFATLFSNPLARKVGLYLSLAALLFLGLRWYSNKAYSDGRTAGVSMALTESLHSSETAWKADLAQLQQRIESSTRNTQVAAQAASVAAHQLEATVAKAADARTAITQQVAAIPVSDLAPKIVANDATVKPDNTESLQRALLGSQMTNKELLAEVQDLTDEWREYKLNANAQVAALQDQLTATQGQLHVMTVERDAYKASFESATKKRGCGTFKKIFTLGVCR
jgi:hypothetical protein